MTLQIRMSLIAIVCVALITMAFSVKRVLGKDVIKSPTTMPTMGSPDHPAGPLDFVVKDIDGKETDLSQYRGKVIMIVNVASKCGYTPQYTGLESLYTTYADRGFVILGFPANNFKSQEPGTNEEIKQFCSSKYSVTFPMMSKISVKGDDQHPLYKFLTERDTDGDFAGDIGWNFTKFLVDRNGNVIARFATPTKPSDPALIAAVEKALDAK
jgi:glutathione peroxidase